MIFSAMAKTPPLESPLESDDLPRRCRKNIQKRLLPRKKNSVNSPLSSLYLSFSLSLSLALSLSLSVFELLISFIIVIFGAVSLFFSKNVGRLANTRFHHQPDSSYIGRR